MVASVWEEEEEEEEEEEVVVEVEAVSVLVVVLGELRVSVTPPAAAEALATVVILEKVGEHGKRPN